MRPTVCAIPTVGGALRASWAPGAPVSASAVDVEGTALAQTDRTPAGVARQPLLEVLDLSVKELVVEGTVDGGTMRIFEAERRNCWPSHTLWRPVSLTRHGQGPCPRRRWTASAGSAGGTGAPLGRRPPARPHGPVRVARSTTVHGCLTLPGQDNALTAQAVRHRENPARHRLIVERQVNLTPPRSRAEALGPASPTCPITCPICVSACPTPRRPESVRRRGDGMEAVLTARLARLRA